MQQGPLTIAQPVDGECPACGGALDEPPASGCTDPLRLLHWQAYISEEKWCAAWHVRNAFVVSAYLEDIEVDPPLSEAEQEAAGHRWIGRCVLEPDERAAALAARDAAQGWWTRRWDPDEAAVFVPLMNPGTYFRCPECWERCAQVVSEDHKQWCSYHPKGPGRPSRASDSATPTT